MQYVHDNHTLRVSFTRTSLRTGMSTHSEGGSAAAGRALACRDGFLNSEAVQLSQGRFT